MSSQVTHYLDLNPGLDIDVYICTVVLLVYYKNHNNHNNNNNNNICLCIIWCRMYIYICLSIFRIHIAINHQKAHQSDKKVQFMQIGALRFSRHPFWKPAGLKPEVLRDDGGILYVARLLSHSQPCGQLQKRRGSGRTWLELCWCGGFHSFSDVPLTRSWRTCVCYLHYLAMFVPLINPYKTS